MDEISTGGGSAISGNAETGGGDLVGRDREPANSNLATGGDLRDSTVVTGKGNRVDNRRSRRSKQEQSPIQNVVSGSNSESYWYSDLKADINSLRGDLRADFAEMKGEFRQRFIQQEQAIRTAERQIHNLMEMETEIKRDMAERLHETKERLWLEVSAQMRAYQQYAQTRFYALWILVIGLIVSVIVLAFRG